MARRASPVTTPPATSEGNPKHVVLRRCPICDWEIEVVEQEPVDGECPVCHAPTERTIVGSILETAKANDKNPHAAALGRLGGLKGGLARAQVLAPARRRAIARKAARARWDKKKQ